MDHPDAGWPFSGLGRYVAVAHMRGEGGDFYTATWPGYVGALTAMAPGRFAACIKPGADVAAHLASLAAPL